MIPPEALVGGPEASERLAAVAAVLVEAQDAGILGRHTAIDEHLEHSLRFVEVVSGPPGRALDLGSGAGVPGLVLAAVWPDTAVVLVDGQLRRVDRLAQAIERLGWTNVSAIHARAEDLARPGSDLRASMDVVTARAFGPPAVTIECAAPFLRVGGAAIVSEPPSEPGPPGSEHDSWDHDDRLADLGVARASAGAGVQVLRCVELCPDRFPRQPAAMRKRPLF